MASVVLPPQAVYTTTPKTTFQSRRLTFLPPFTSVSTRCRLGCGTRSRDSFVVRAAADVVDETTNEEEEEEKEAVEERAPKKPIVKLGDIMGILNKQAIEASDSSRPVPDLRTGDIVEIKLEVPENRRRLSIYKGIIISKQNAGIHTTIRIRRIIAGVGVEIVFPIYSPNIKEIKVVKHRKVRRARLYYLRDKLPRLSTFK
ncbi:large ribosomal subunit protein bL19cz-like [Bidens hawaiensis]|uniref:large ribosomal subunit protein bL19cz-like n=2 Tax=Bidens hawaiensis TaxID=980011 RepID=UPI00404AB483